MTSGLRWRRTMLPLSVLIGLTILWEILVRLDTSPARVLPAPSEVITALIRTRQTLLTEHIPQTLAETLIGLAIALVGGISVAAVLDFSPLLKRALYPLLVISQTIPIVALAPILILVFGFGIGPKVYVVVLFCFFPITVATLDGLTATDPDLVLLLWSVGATRLQIWRKARFPAALPALFSGLRIAATYSVTGAVFGEFVTAQYGLGQYLRSAYSSGQIDQGFAAIVIVALLSIGLVGLVTLIEHAALPWVFAPERQLEWKPELDKEYGI